MKEEEQENNSRRKFLSLGFSGREEPKPRISSSSETEEKIPMLTADGKLVEIEKSLLEKIQRQKASNRDILNWSEPLKHSKLN